MSGISYMVPMCIAAGLLLAIANVFAFQKDDLGRIVNWGFDNTTTMGYFMQKLFAVGQIGFKLMIPLFAGFVSKVYFATASIYSPGKMAATLITLAISMVLNAMYFIPSVIAIWAPPLKNAVEFKVVPLKWSFCLSMVLFIGLNMGLGIFYQPVINMIEMGISLL